MIAASLALDSAGNQPLSLSVCSLLALQARGQIRVPGGLL